MTNQSTKQRFAEILRQAQAKAEAQVTKKQQPQQVTPPPPPVAKAYVQPQPITPKLTARVVTRDNLVTRYTEVKPELSTMTISDLVGEVVKPKPTTDLRIVAYSDKCIVVVGNTKANKDRLKAIGGKYNAYLKCGEGWVFPKWKEAEIRAKFSL